MTTETKLSELAREVAAIHASVAAGAAERARLREKREQLLARAFTWGVRYAYIGMTYAEMRALCLRSTLYPDEAMLATCPELRAAPDAQQRFAEGVGLVRRHAEDALEITNAIATARGQA